MQNVCATFAVHNAIFFALEHAYQMVMIPRKKLLRVQKCVEQAVEEEMTDEQPTQSATNGSSTLGVQHRLTW